MSDQVSRPAACFVCRCEELTLTELEDTITSGARTINDVKRRTRAGMGPCQGAYCLEHIANLLHARLGTPLDQIAPMTARPPVRGIPLASLAGNEATLPTPSGGVTL